MRWAPQVQPSAIRIAAAKDGAIRTANWRDSRVSTSAAGADMMNTVNSVSQ